MSGPLSPAGQRAFKKSAYLNVENKKSQGPNPYFSKWGGKRRRSLKRKRTVHRRKRTVRSTKRKRTVNRRKRTGCKGKSMFLIF